MTVNFNDVLSVAQAAKFLGVSDRRVRQFIENGRLPATSFSGAYLIDKKHAREFKAKDRKPGRKFAQ